MHSNYAAECTFPLILGFLRGSHGYGVLRMGGGSLSDESFRHCVVRLNIEKSARLNILNFVNGLRSHVCRCGLPG